MLEQMWGKYISSRDGALDLTPEEVRWFHVRVGELTDGNPELAKMFRLDEVLSRQYARGKRCGVCGMTTAQAKAANYNCTYEC